MARKTGTIEEYSTLPRVHVFASLGRFRSLEDILTFIHPKYTDDGDCLDSDFIREAKISEFEPACIEAIHSPTPKPLNTLLEGASYCEQWLPSLPPSSDADAAICVFEPNVVGDPESTSLRYYGSFFYRP